MLLVGVIRQTEAWSAGSIVAGLVLLAVGLALLGVMIARFRNS
jgi:hypothetical protein